MALNKDQFIELRRQGLSVEQIIKFEQGFKPQTEKKGVLNTLEKAVSPLKSASNFLFGTTGKTVGSLLGAGYESAKQLVTGKREEGKFITAEGTPKIFSQQDGELRSKPAVATDIAFTALELYPGGGLISKHLKALPGGNKVASAISNVLNTVPENLKAKAIEQYASIFRATSKESKGLVEKVVPKLLEENKVITSTAKLADTAKEKLLTIGDDIDKIISKLPKDKQISARPAIEVLDNLKSKYFVGGKAVNPDKINAIDKVRQTIAQFGDKIPAQDFIQIRRLLDESVNEAGGFIADKATKFIARVEKSASGAMRNELSKAIPNLSRINAQYSFWSNVKNLASYTTKKAQPILRRSIAGGVGGVIGATRGEGIEGKITGAAIGVLLGNKAIQYMQSPTWKSVSAITKNKIADNIAKGNFKTVGEIFRRLIAGTKNVWEN